MGALLTVRVNDALPGAYTPGTIAAFAVMVVVPAPTIATSPVVGCTVATLVLLHE